MSKDRKQDQREVEVSDILAVMTTPSGRRVLARILNFTGMDVDTFDEDPYRHARNSGLRSVGLWLKSELKDAAPDKFMLMLQEQTEDG